MFETVEEILPFYAEETCLNEMNMLNTKAIWLTLGNDSLKNTATNPKLIIVRLKENIAGQNHQFPVELAIPAAVNAAPVTGPTIKPTAKAMPINALENSYNYKRWKNNNHVSHTMALALVELSVMSAITAVARLTLALLIPPTARARIKSIKLSDTIQIA